MATYVTPSLVGSLLLITVSAPVRLVGQHNGLEEFLASRDYDLESIVDQDSDYLAVVARRNEALTTDPQRKVIQIGPGGREVVLVWDGERYYWGADTLDASTVMSLSPLELPEDAIEDGFGRVRELLLLQVRLHEVHLLHAPIFLGLFEPKAAEWLSIGGQRVFWVSVDQAVEGRVGSDMYLVTGSRASMVYHDKATCIPAELMDVDGDGALELLSFQDDASMNEHCSQCVHTIREDYGVAAAWVNVHRWDGSQWVTEADSYREFYADLAISYELVAKALPADPSGLDCGPDLGRLLSGWAVRAGELAETGGS